jgi:hypothetical protein
MEGGDSMFRRRGLAALCFPLLVTFVFVLAGCGHGGY